VAGEPLTQTQARRLVVDTMALLEQRNGPNSPAL